MSALAASVLLGLMILPTIIKVSETSIRAVPKATMKAGLLLEPPMKEVFLYCSS